MASRINLFTLPQIPKFQNHTFIPNSVPITQRLKTHILCSKSNLGDAELGSNLASKVAKINTHLEQKKEAMEKSRGLLFTELCQYLSMEEGEAKKKWGKMNEEERWVLAKEFVNEWGENFHPLSARSVKEMLDGYLIEEKLSSNSNSSSSDFFLGLKKFLGL